MPPAFRFLVLALACVLTACNPAPAGPTPPPPPGAPGPLQIRIIGFGNNQEDLEGDPLPHRLEVLVSRDGVPQAGVPIEWSTTSGVLTQGPPHTSTSGTAWARLTLGNTPGDVEVTARITGADDVPPAVFNATSLEQVQAVIEPLGNAQVGEVGTTLPLPLRVRVTRDGAPRAGVPVTWVASFGTMSAPTTLTDANGYAQVFWTLGTLPNRVAATASVRGARHPLSFTATSVAGPPQELFVLWSPSSVPANHYGVGSQIQLKDRYGNGVAGAAVEWRVLSGPAEIRAFDALTNSSGHSEASFDPTGTEGEVRVRAHVPAHSLLHEFTFQATAPQYDVEVYADWSNTANVVFFSPRNLSQPVVDTVPVGTRVRWISIPDDFGLAPPTFTLLSVGPSHFDGGIVGTTPLGITFTAPGTYRYQQSGGTASGTVVVQ